MQSVRKHSTLNRIESLVTWKNWLHPNRQAFNINKSLIDSFERRRDVHFFITNSLYLLSTFRQSESVLLFISGPILDIVDIKIYDFFVDSEYLIISGSSKSWVLVISLNFSPWPFYTFNIFIFFFSKHDALLLHFFKNVFFLSLVLSLVVFDTVVDSLPIFQEQRH